MAFKLKIQRTLHAPAAAVWDALTNPETVKKYFFGTNLVTSWQPGTPIEFRGEWDGKPYLDKGTVLAYEEGKFLKYDYLSSWSEKPDLPENYQDITYRVIGNGAKATLIVTQNKIDTLELKVHSMKNWAMMIDEIRKLIEA